MPSRSSTRGRHGPATFVDLLRHRGAEQPEQLGYSFLLDDRQTVGITYGQLDRRARALAAVLREAGATGERVVLLLAPGLEYVVAFYAVLAAGAVVVPAYPYRAGRPSAALDAMVRDARARFAIVRSRDREPNAVPDGLVPIAVDDVPDAAADAFREPTVRPRQLALIQYTSGSTSAPRGAMLDHERLMVDTRAVADALGADSDAPGVSWLPPYHDMGMFGGIVVPLLSATHAVLMAPRAFLQRPARWLQTISDMRAAWSGGPNFAYDLAVTATTPEDRAGLDLSSWRTAVNGAEWIRPETVRRFSEAFAPSGFRAEAFLSMYGLAEGGLVASRRPIEAVAFDAAALSAGQVRAATDEQRATGQEPVPEQPEATRARSGGTRDIVNSGPPEAIVDVAIVDPESRSRVADDRVGEIWISGPGVVRSYWRRPAESRRVLRARLAGDDREWVRTGDLGFLRDGELFVTGRAKELIIVAGRNFYPVDIERTAERSHPAVRSGGVAAFALEGTDTERVGVVAEIDRRTTADPGEILAAIRRAVAEEHELGIQLVTLIGQGRLPRTTSGKTQRGLARDQLLNGQLTSIASWSAGQERPEAWLEPSAIARPAPAVKTERAAGGARPPAPDGPSARAIEAWLVAHIADRLGHAQESIDRQAPFLHFGLGSVEATALAAELATWLGRPLSPTLTWEHPTIERLAAFLADGPAEQPDEFVAAPQEPIAILGLGVRFPGAPDLDAFRELLRTGGDAIREAPADRLPLEELYDPNPATPGKVVSRNGGFLDGVDLFDPQFFGISPREASRMDPQQRLLLEVTQEALEHAALPAKKLAGSATGVFVGIGSFDFNNLQLSSGADISVIDAYHGTGIAHSIAANRISFLYDLRGPSLALDTACSSSLVAVHLACQSLLTHESDLALAGGVNVILTADATVAFSQARMLSPDGHSKAFDASADGYVRAEGAGVVVLKRLSDARRDGDRVIALIRGTAVNQDGLTSGITAPNGRAQQEVTRTALARAGITAADLGAIEAHGTGTPLGDPIEVNALAEVVGPRAPEDPDRTVWLSSVKANVGHLEMASGMAGLAKAVLELSYGEIYPQIHFETLNPHIRIGGTPLRIPTELTPWPLGPKPRYLGISSFGFGGTNAHLVLEESREPIAPRSHVDRPLHLMTLSAKTESALRELAKRTIEQLDREPDVPIEDVAYTANVGRTRHLHNSVVVAGSRDQLRERLAAVAAGKGSPGVFPGRRAAHAPPVAFLFTGQGAQYAGMGRELYETQPTFREALDRAVELIDPYLDRPLRALLFPAAGAADLLSETGYTQPALFALEYALAELWKSWGVVPDVVLGHSVGEYAAAVTAGALSLEDGARLIVNRGRLMQLLPREGAMAAVLAPLETVEAAIASEPEIVVAGINAPDNIAIAGRRDALARVVEALEADAVTVVPLKVSHAFHSPLMDPILDELETLASSVEHRPLQMAFAANLTGQLLGPGATLDAGYWRNHARHAVQFSADVRAAHEFGAQIFIEIGPTPTLVGLARRSLPGVKATWAPSLKAGEDAWQTLLSAVATTYSAGRDIDWAGFDRDYRRRVVTLPSYPFERTRHWFAAHDGSGDGTARSISATADRGHGLLRTVLGTPHPAVQARVSAASPAWLGDHRIQGTVVAPAALLMEMMLAAAPSPAPGASAEPDDAVVTVEDVEFVRALFLGDAPHVLQAIVAPPGIDGRPIQLYGRPDTAPDDWTLHATARLSAAGTPAGADPAAWSERLAAARERCTTQVPVDEFYRLLAERGLEYGPTFRGIRQLYRRDGEAVALVDAPERVAGEIGRYRLHPAILDAALQVLAASMSTSEAGGGTYLPVGVSRLRLVRAPSARMWVVATRSDDAGVGGTSEGAAALTREGDLRILDEDGSLIAELIGLRVQQLEPAGRRSEDSIEDWLYRIVWQPVDASAEAPSIAGTWLVLAGHDPAASVFAARLRGAGATVHLAVPDDVRDAHAADFRAAVGSGDAVLAIRRELAQRGAPLDGIVSFWPLDAEWAGAAASAPHVMAAAIGALPSNDEATTSGRHRGRSTNGLRPANGRARARNGNGHRAAAAGGAGPTVVEAVAAPTLGALRLIGALAGDPASRPLRVVLITRGAASGTIAEAAFETADETALAQAAVVGFARSARMEHPELSIRVVDLEPAARDAVGDPGDATLVALSPAIAEPELAIRAGRLYARRLERTERAAPAVDTTAGEADTGADTAGDSGAHAGLRVPARPYRLEPANPGMLDTLTLRPAARRAPGAGEVEIEVEAAGVNFRDVMKALGIYPQAPGDVQWLGDELAGRVVTVGEGVDLEVGDEVFGVAPAAFGNLATTRAEFILRRPPTLAPEDAATLPIVFSTALYALRDLARLQPGERVLIHAAAGGVGQAAIQIAHALGAQVLATASESKREFIRSLGVEHVFDSRSLEFVDGVREATGGTGVDVVLNSLAGEFIPASIGVLAPYGRFVEIGKRDIFANAKLGLWPFRNNLSFHAVDMDRVFRDKPAIGAALLADVQRGIADGTYRPLSRTTYPIAQAVTAFRFLANGRHIGKVVLSFADAARTSEPASVGSDAGVVAFRPDAAYLVTGGLRGLGARVAEWMALLGARQLVLVGRDPGSEAARETVRRLDALGARSTLLAADMADPDQVAAVLHHVHSALPPLRGIVHAAGVLADASLLNLTDDAVLKVFGPKAAGAVNLHRATRDLELDFFVSFSSMASAMGNPGQANYAAANALLDRLAWLRAAEGLAGQTINWGPWAEIGMSAAAEGQRIFGFGVSPIPPASGIAALERVMTMPEREVLVLRMDWARFISIVPGASTDPFLERVRAGVDRSVAEGGVSPTASVLASVLAVPEEERPALIEQFLQAELAKVLDLEPGDLPLDQPLNTVGLDSLMALELKNRVEVALAITLPIVTLIQGPTISQLAEDLLARVEVRAVTDGNGPVGGAAAGGDGAPTPDEIAVLMSRSTGSKSRTDE